MITFPEIPASWSAPELEKAYADILPFLRNEYAAHACCPPARSIFRALELTPPDSVKAVIIGQDPYHGPGQAMGLSFSVLDGIKAPPSLKNIFREIEDETGKCPQSNDLTSWARQGVLLLNTTLTVRENAPASHAKAGWARFTSGAVKRIASGEKPVVWLLWGSYAESLRPFITNPDHLILSCAHPSPLSAYRGFFGCGHFTAANEYLQSHGLAPINW